MNDHADDFVEAVNFDTPDSSPDRAVNGTPASSEADNGLRSGFPDRMAQPVDDEEPPRLPFPVVGIGGSAGGLEAFFEFFDTLPADSGICFVLIQHLPPERESMVAELLDRRANIPVTQVEDGVVIEPNHAYVIRPGRTMMLRNGRLHLGEPTAKRGHQHPIDDFFRSLAEEQQERAVAIVMSGMGSNGTAGAQAIKAVGGVCIAQDPEQAKFASMPRSLINVGLADFVLAAREMPEAILRFAHHPYAQRREPAEAVLSRDQQAFGEIVSLLRSRSRQDFSGYKKPTILRRIQRRMSLHQVLELDEYVRLLRRNPSEANDLADDLVIHVTGFFRDPEAWDSLRRNVIDPMIAARDNQSVIRAWVTACSSGEEAYTLAILLSEAVEASGKTIEIKIFATDLADRSLSSARQGVFPQGIVSEVSPERLDRFFDRDDSSYRIKKPLRELVVFAPQNVLQDPPFSRLDICTCRNLLIYLEPSVQRRVLSLIHFGLRQDGTLFLGNSETVSGTSEQFEPIDKKWRIYRRIGAVRYGAIEFPQVGGMSRSVHTDPGSSLSRVAPRASLSILTQRTLLDRFAPPSVVVDSEGRIVYFHGETSPFLSQPSGEPVREVLSLAREGVRAPLRVALHRALTERAAPATQAGYVDSAQRGRETVTVTVVPLDAHGAEGHYLVSFQVESLSFVSTPVELDDPSSEHSDFANQIRRIKDELQSTVEELQTSNEELKASNEEVTSVNEELQSTNEELETSKEELQSLNEELTTVNAQLQAKMEELENTTNDLSSLLGSTDIAVVFLDRRFRIRRFTPAVLDLLDLIASDIGRPLSDLAPKFDDPDLMRDVRTVLDKLIPLDREVKSESGHWYLRRVLPYRTLDNRIDGIVITFVDVTGRRLAELAQREVEERYRLMIANVKDYAIVMLDEQGVILTWNSGAEQIFGEDESVAIGKNYQFLFTAEDRQVAVPREDLTTARETGQTVFERWYQHHEGRRFWAAGTLNALKANSAAIPGFVLILSDSTNQKRVEEHLQRAHQESEELNTAKDQFLATVSHELRTPLSAILLWSQMINQGLLEGDEFKEATLAIQHNAESQQRLIEDLLDTSRICSGKLRLNQVEIKPAQVIRGAIESVMPAAAAKGVKIMFDLPADVGVVVADPDRLQQVIWNLLNNAVKFTPVGGDVWIDLTREAEEIVIHVADTGVGIPPAMMARLFDRFFQVESPQSRTQGGLGLGLAITRQLIELHGGAIDVQSRDPEPGTVFTIRLPLPVVRQPADDRPANAPSTPDWLRGVSILLVEDATETRKALETLLTRAGAEVVSVDRASSAFERLRQRRPDILISDIGLPEMDGYTFVAQIRADEVETNQMQIPAIALTAFAREVDRDRAFAAGFQDCMTKPCDSEKLIQLVASLLEIDRPPASPST